jgi:hypothetical protein
MSCHLVYLFNVYNPPIETKLILVRCLSSYQCGLACCALSLAVRLFSLPRLPRPPCTPQLHMAATASLAATAPSCPALLKPLPLALISLRPVSRCCKSPSVKAKVSNLVFPAYRYAARCSLLISTPALGVLG